MYRSRNPGCDDKPHVCQTCGSRYKYRHNLRQHMKAHTGETFCEICGKHYSNKYNLSVHMRFSNFLKLRSCSVFDLGSRNAKDLWTYDWGSKKYVCTVCGAAYKHKHNLLGHLRAHTGETYCAFCDKVYSTKGNFDTHMTTVHRRKPSVSGSQSLEMS
nr:PREDICTED: gastrula zinc finger protein XlCGF8.2DB-like [Bemisia tabaci]